MKTDVGTPDRALRIGWRPTDMVHPRPMVSTATSVWFDERKKSG